MRTLVATVTLLVVGLLPGPRAPGVDDASAALEAAAKEAEQAGRLREAFDIYVRAVQALPDPPPLDVDSRLREKLVTLVEKIEPRPPQPEDAERYAVRGQILFKEAQDTAALKEAAAELRKSVRAAPWDGALAYNLALVEEKLQHYKSAAINLKLYLRTNPKDAADARARVYALELRLERNPSAAATEDCDFNVASGCVALGRSLVKENADPNGPGYGYLVRGCGLGDAQGCLEAAHVSLEIARQLKRPKERSARVSAAQATLDKLNQACDLNSALACLELGDLYVREIRTFGLRTDRNTADASHAKALALAEKGCNARVAQDCLVAGLIYEDGRGVRRDRASAGAFYARACAMDKEKVPDACASAARLRK